MIRLGSKIIDMMQGPDSAVSTGLTLGMQALAKAYGGAINLRTMAYGRQLLKTKRLPRTVISIGNLTTGGTGKTPMTLYLAERLRGRGLRVAVLSRGYKGSAERTGAVVSDGRDVLLGVAAAGDEAFLMARHLPEAAVLVGRDRCRSGLAAIERFAPDVLLLDDGFQHLRLERDLNLVLLDWNNPLGNGHLLPRGPMREPLSALKRADAIVATRTPLQALDGQGPMGGGADWRKVLNAAAGRPVFRASHKPFVRAVVYPAHGSAPEAGPGPESDLEALRNRSFWAFAGLGRNRYFRQTLSRLGCRLVGFTDFADHHAYTGADLRTVCEAAARSQAEGLLTTEKDFVKLPQDFQWPCELAVIGVRIDMGRHAAAFDALCEKALAASRRHSADA